MTEEVELKLSPQDIQRLADCRSAIAQATGALNDIPDDVREEFGELEDAISKLEEADDLVAGCLPSPETGAAEPNPA